MKVKVTPRDGAGNPIPGAGSFEVESSMMPDGSCFGAEGAHFPASWCEAIPEITPEPGDICEVWNNKASRHYVYVYFCAVNNNRHRTQTIDKQKGNYVDWDNCRVLARKPKGGLDAHDAIHEFFRALSDAETASADVAAYNKFLSAILGVPYGRVG